MKDKLFTVYQSNSGVVVEVELSTITQAEVENTMNFINNLLPKG